MVIAAQWRTVWRYRSAANGEGWISERVDSGLQLRVDDGFRSTAVAQAAALRNSGGAVTHSDRPVAARRRDGPTFAGITPGSPIEVLGLLTVLRYHRSDAHHRAWAGEGYTAAEVQSLAGAARQTIEADTNQYRALPG